MRALAAAIHRRIDPRDLVFSRPGGRGFWMDPSYIGSMQTAQGGTTNSSADNDNVGQMRDRIFGHMWSRPSSIPVLRRQAGKLYLEYATSSRSLSDDDVASNLVTQNATGCTSVVTVLFQNTGAIQTPIFYSTSSSSSSRFSAVLNASNFLEAFIRRTNAEAAAQITGATNRSGVLGVFTNVVDYVGGTCKLYWNHTLDVTGSLTSAGLSDSTACAATFMTGRITTNTMGLNSRIYESTIFNWAFSPSERMREVERQAKKHGVSF